MIPARAGGVALLALVLGSVALGASPILVRFSDVDPLATAVYRTWLGLPLLLAWMAHEWRSSRGRPFLARGDGRALALAGILFAGDLANWHWSIVLTSVANATLLANLAPAFVVAGAFLLYRERPTRRFLAGMGVALVGVVVLSGGSGFASARLAGDALGIVTAVFWGSYLLAVKGLRGRLSTGTIMACTSAVTGLTLLPLALLFEERLVPATAGGWAALAGLAFVTHALGQGGIAYGLAHLPAGFSSLVILIEPLVAAILGWAVLDEPIGGAQWVGGGAVLAGILLAQGRARPAPRVGTVPP